MYFAGDTDLFDGMADAQSIDVALLPIAGWGPSLGTGHLDPDRAARATELIRPRLVVPIHWGTYSPISCAVGRRRGCTLRPSSFASAMADAGHGDRLRLLEPGGRLGPRRSPRRWSTARTAKVNGPGSGRPAARRATVMVTRRMAQRRRHRRDRGDALDPRRLLAGFSIDRPRDALLAGLVVGLVGAVVWPALAFVVVPISVLTLGLGAIVLEALVVALVLDLLPGVNLDGFWTAIVVTVALAAVTTTGEQPPRPRRRLLVRPDHRPARPPAGRYGDRHRRARCRVRAARRGRQGRTRTGAAVRRRPHAPSLDPRRHAPAGGWQTGWSSQTGVSQCGILHGSTVDMPAFRWVDKSTGDVVVSNHRKWARRSSTRTLTATDCSPTTGRATATSFPATPNGPC